MAHRFGEGVLHGVPAGLPVPQNRRGDRAELCEPHAVHSFDVSKGSAASEPHLETKTIERRRFL